MDQAVSVHTQPTSPHSLTVAVLAGFQEYTESTRAVEGVHSLPNGVEYYQACLDWYLGVRVTPEEVFELGVREVSRIEGNIKKVSNGSVIHVRRLSSWLFVTWWNESATSRCSHGQR